MIHSESRFTGCRGRSIFYQCWDPESAPRALLVLSHGLGEHSGRYPALAAYFVGHGFAVGGLDHNGHGASDGVPGDVQAFDDYVSDLAQLRDILVSRHPDIPVFLLAHSMGALVGASYLFQAQQQFDGAVMSGIPVKTGTHPGPLLQWLIRFFAVVAPRLGLTQLDAAGVSRDPEVVKNYIEDPLVYHGKLRARLLREFFAAIARLENEAGSLTLPLLLVHGGKDAMVLPESSRLIHAKAGSSDKTLSIYPELYHEVFNEPEREEVLAEVLDWLNTRLKPV